MSDVPANLGLTLDLEREARCGFPEVVFGEGKTPAAVVEAVEAMKAAGQDVLVTRTSAEQAAAVLAAVPAVVHHEQGRTLRLDLSNTDVIGSVCVVTAGTADLPVAYEAIETLHWMRVGCELITDVGVAGPKRLLARVDEIRAADVVVCIAGMEAALASVVGGWVSCPVIAVPTSVGYGASLGGIAALLGMLNSCAANVSVVNIDAGFKGAYIAGMIARRGGGASSDS